VVLVAIVASIISVFFYVRVILLMFFTDAEVDDADPATAAGGLATVTKPSLLTSATITACVALTLALGIVPGPVLDLAAHAGQFIR
jgi:NADH-quinone oxidoreductase subunit N